MIARILYDKGYREYIEAARIVGSRHQHIVFQLLGNIDPEYPNHVPEQEVKRDSIEGTISYLGYTNNVIDKIREADCIVLPSYYNEGLSRVLMEALAMGKPIITTNIPGCKETVDNGMNGFVIPPRDIAALVESMETIINMENYQRIKMGHFSREKAEREFDVKNVIRVYEEITRHLI